MTHKINALDCGGGHIIVALFVFVVGIGMVAFRLPKGEDVIVGALASLWTSLQTKKPSTAS